MPIYRPNNGLNVKFEKLSTSTLESLHKPTLEGKDIEKSEVRVIGRKRKRCFQVAMAILCVLFIIVALFVAKTLFMHMHYTPFCMVMEVDYYDKENSKVHGSFQESVTIDAEDDFEIIEVPKVRSFMRNVIIHDFPYNVTAVVNHMKAVCYVMPLNKTRTHKPRNVIDLIKKFKSGHYVKRSELLNEYYSVELPRKQELSAYGPMVETDCAYYDVYYLRKIDPTELLGRGDRRIIDHYPSRIEHSSHDVQDDYADYYSTYDQNDVKKNSWTKGDNLLDDEDDEEISNMIKNDDKDNHNNHYNDDSDINDDSVGKDIFNSNDEDFDDKSEDFDDKSEDFDDKSDDFDDKSDDFNDKSDDFDDNFYEEYDEDDDDFEDRVYHNSHHIKKGKPMDWVEDKVNDGARIYKHRGRHGGFKRRESRNRNEIKDRRYKRNVERAKEVDGRVKIDKYKIARVNGGRGGCFMRGDSFCLGTIIDPVLPCLKLVKCHEVKEV